MHTHHEYEDDHTEYEPGVVVGYTDPHETTGSDAETAPLPRDPRPIASRYNKWRLYHRINPTNGRLQWCAYQPDEIEEPMFPASDKFSRTLGGLYGTHGESGADVLARLQLALAKADAAAHLAKALEDAA